MKRRFTTLLAVWAAITPLGVHCFAPSMRIGGGKGGGLQARGRGCAQNAVGLQTRLRVPMSRGISLRSSTCKCVAVGGRVLQGVAGCCRVF